MTIDEAIVVQEDGCDHPPRVGGWCLACDRAMHTLGVTAQDEP